MAPSTTEIVVLTTYPETGDNDAENVVTSVGQTLLLDDRLKHILSIIFLYVLQIPVTVFGTGTNIVNIVVFLKSGLNDSVSIAFFALSISDLGYLTIFNVIRTLGLLVTFFSVQGKIHLAYLAFYVSFFGVLFQDISVVVTVYLAVQKCCCVAIPHLFKNVFSPRKTIVIILCLVLCMILIYVPIYAGMSFYTIKSPSNKTMILIARNHLYFKGYDFWLTFNKIVLPATSQGITIVCLIIMAIQLQKSAKFRAPVGKDSTNINPSSDTKNVSAKLGYKERRALAAVGIVSTIFVVSTIPASIWSYVRLIAKRFFGDPRNTSFMDLLDNSQNIPVHVSASVNMFVYLKYNTKYRETAKALFHKCLCCIQNDDDKRKV